MSKHQDTPIREATRGGRPEEIGDDQTNNSLTLARYYLTNQEIWILENYSERIAERIPNNALIIELGSGYCALTHHASS